MHASPSRPEPASRSYTTARSWEALSSLSEEQEQAFVEAPQESAPSTSAAARGEERSAGSSSGRGGGSSSPYASLDDVVMHSSSQFYRWHSGLQAARTLETEEKYRQYAESLQGQLHTCDSLSSTVFSFPCDEAETEHDEVGDTLQLFELLQGQHHAVSAKTRALSTSCERLVAEQTRLVEFAGALRAKLAYFDELERIAAKFQSAALSVDSEHFLPLLHRLDECIMYVTSNPQYADAAAYAGKFRQLQARALGAIRTCVQQVLRQAAEQVQAGLREARLQNSQQLLLKGRGSGSLRTPRASGAGSEQSDTFSSRPSSSAPLPEGADTTLLYVRFRAAAESGLKGVMSGVAARAARPEYAQLLADCQRSYCEIRLALVAGVVGEHVASLAFLPLPAFTRAAASYLAQVCQMEQQLFAHFVPAVGPGAVEAEGDPLAPLVNPLCTVLYDALRPAFIQLQAMEALCEIAEILQHECLDEGLQWKGEASAHLRPVLQRALADVQERLTYRAQAFVRDEVTNFVPKGEDVAFPECLQAGGGSEGEGVGAGSQAAEEQSEIQPLQQENGHSAPGKEEEVPDQPSPLWALEVDLATTRLEDGGGGAVGGGVVPPVRHTLRCLGRIYSCVERPVFAGLAQEAVVACAAAVQAGSRLVAKRSGLLDGQLFLIKQLLILREHIAPFEADFSVMEKDLDFSHMRDHLRRIYSGRASLFTLSAENAVVQLVSRGAPRILETQVDGKKDVEKLLKGTCEAFILTLTRQTVEPLLTFITKVTAVRVAAASAAASKPLREQAFAAPDRLREVVSRVKVSLAEYLPGAVAKMKLYLHNPATHAILFRPVKANIAEAHGQIEALLRSDYTVEEAAGMGLLSPSELRGILNSLC